MISGDNVKLALLRTLDYSFEGESRLA